MAQKRSDDTRPRKFKDPAHIWDDVNEETRSLCITNRNQNDQGLKIMTDNLIKIVGGKNIKPYPEPNAVINIRDYPPGSIKNLKGLPENLPNLLNFHMRFVKFRSLKGFPKHVPKLQKFSIWFSNISNLEGLPEEFPSLKSFGITKCPVPSLKGMPQNLPNLETLSLDCEISSLEYFPQSLPNLKKLNIRSPNLESLQYLPQDYPNLENLEIHSPNLNSLRHFPQDLPSLKELMLGNKLTSLKGLPRKLPNLRKIFVYGNLTSFEDLPEIVGTLYPPPRVCGISFNPRPLRTLAGIKYRPFFYVNITCSSYKEYNTNYY